MNEARAGIVIARCEGCGAGYYPHRLLCWRCGGRSFKPVVVTEGVVEEATTVRRAVAESAREETVLASVRLAGGQRVIAGSATSLEPGTAVALTDDAGAVTIRPVA